MYIGYILSDHIKNGIFLNFILPEFHRNEMELLILIAEIKVKEH